MIVVGDGDVDVDVGGRRVNGYSVESIGLVVWLVG